MCLINVDQFFDFVKTQYPRLYGMSIRRTRNYGEAIQFIAYHTGFNRKLTMLSTTAIPTQNYLWNLKQCMIQPQCVQYLNWIENADKLIVKSSGGKYKQL